MSNINLINKELKQVNNLIKKDIIKEKTISKLYKYIFRSSGKQLRAKLNLISSSSNKKIRLRRYKLAAVIELLHTATLVHDDVVDESEIRRGTKSVNNIWSNAHGVLIGDYIYSKAFMLMVELGNPKILDELSKATNDISKGELIQLDAIKNTKITLEKLEDISYFKTGRLFEASAKCGAILSNSSNSYQRNITNCSKNLGVVFQIKDDLLDYSSDETIIGKPILQDIREGKVTYPFYFAYKKASLEEKKYLESKLGNKKQNNKKIIELITNLGGIKETENLAIKYFMKSKQAALKIENKNIREEMLNLLDVSIHRKK
jgi:octaprenyl-diphosphate synthase